MIIPYVIGNQNICLLYYFVSRSRNISIWAMPRVNGFIMNEYLLPII
jgi:hypothetical protein